MASFLFIWQLHLQSCNVINVIAIYISVSLRFIRTHIKIAIFSLEFLLNYANKSRKILIANILYHKEYSILFLTFAAFALRWTNCLKRVVNCKLQLVISMTLKVMASTRDSWSPGSSFFLGTLTIIDVTSRLIVAHIKYRAAIIKVRSFDYRRLSKSRDGLAFNELNRTRDVSWRWIIVVSYIEHHGGTPRPRSPYGISAADQFA